MVLPLQKFYHYKMHFVTCAALAAVLFTTLIENLSLCSSAMARIVFNLFLNFEQK